MTTSFLRRAGRIATAFVRSFRPELLATAAAAGVAAVSFLGRASDLAWKAQGTRWPGWETMTAAAGNLGSEMGLFIAAWMFAQPYFRERRSQPDVQQSGDAAPR